MSQLPARTVPGAFTVTLSALYSAVMRTDTTATVPPSASDLPNRASATNVYTGPTASDPGGSRRTDGSRLPGSVAARS